MESPKTRIQRLKAILISYDVVMAEGEGYFVFSVVTTSGRKHDLRLPVGDTSFDIFSVEEGEEMSTAIGNHISIGITKEGKVVKVFHKSKGMEV